MVDDIDPVQDKNVVAVIDFRHTTIYLTGALPGERPEQIVASG